MRSDKYRNKKNAKISNRSDYLDEQKALLKDFYDDDNEIFGKNQKKGDALFDRSEYDDLGHIDVKLDSDNKKKNNKKRRKNSIKKNYSKKCPTKLRTFFRIIILLLLILAVLAVGFFFYMSIKVGKMDKVEVAPAAFQIDDSVSDELSNFRNIAVLGTDNRKGESKEGSRTDAIIVVSINKKTDEISLISVMRDSYLYMENSNKELVLDKVTHAHAFGGPVNTVATLNRSMDLNIDEFIVLDWNSVADLVDSFGGITLDIQSNEISDLNKWGPETAANTNREWNNITSTGPQLMDGAQVTTYCRIRKTSGGDTARTSRMKNVIQELLKTAISKPTKVNEALDTVMPEIQTNMNTSDFTSLLPEITKFDIDKSIGWPYEYYGGIISGKWLAVPRTLDSNVNEMYKEAFAIDNHTISSQCQNVNDLIINQTGIQ